jgi:hypothetical protein
MFTDSETMDKGAMLLGNYLISLHEHLLHKTFPDSGASNIIIKHKALYTRVEILEKNNIGQPCPFSWDEIYKIGWKTAPLFAVFELIMTKSDKTTEEISLIIEGLFKAAAAVQMLDDLGDAAEDICNGFETLVMKGFFEKNGKKPAYTPGEINAFLSQKKLKQFYLATQQLFEDARVIFMDTNDTVLQLFLELQNLKFNKCVQVK